MYPFHLYTYKMFSRTRYYLVHLVRYLVRYLAHLLACPEHDTRVSPLFGAPQRSPLGFGTPAT